MKQSIKNQTDAVANLFNGKASSWAAKYDRRLKTRFKVITDALLRHCPTGNTLLDLGCGTGELSFFAGKRGFYVTAVDISSDMINICKTKLKELPEKYSVINGDYFLLAKEIGIFDAVLCSSVFEYLPEPADKLSLISEHLSSGGFVFISIPNIYSVERFIESVLKCVLTPIKHMRFVKRLQPFLKYLCLSKTRIGPHKFNNLCNTNGLDVKEIIYFGNRLKISFSFSPFQSMILFVLQKR
jgi:2-polyprenyl-6-hydroxyphenyl methylase/3-demethylubiquinone-9 3-methyltransferase